LLNIVVVTNLAGHLDTANYKSVVKRSYLLLQGENIAKKKNAL
jgi:hypothetical protein